MAQGRAWAVALSINTLIGTGGALTASGFTFPGATTPFGMVRLSPDTTFHPPLSLIGGNIATSGYNYHHDGVLGFSHTRLTGAGVAEGGLLRVVPVSRESSFEKRRDLVLKLDHHEEEARAGYYRIRFP